LILIISISSGKDNSTLFQNYGLSFEIPKNWSIAKIEQLNSSQNDGSLINDTKIVLSDGKSAIRIDIIEIPQMPWLLSFYEKDPSIFPWFIETFYRKTVINLGDCYEEGYSGEDHSVGLPVSPDGVERVGFLVCNNYQTARWTIAWTKPEYVKKFIGINAIIEGDYPIVKDIRGGYSEERYSMQEPLYELLDSLTTNFSSGGKLAKTSTLSSGGKHARSSLIDRV
jgi:hypothetical protein